MTSKTHRRQHRRALHGTAVVRVQHQWPTRQLLPQARLSQQLRGLLGTLTLMNFVGDQFAAVDAFDHVPVEVTPSEGGWQPGDIPAPQLIRAIRHVCGWCPLHRRGCCCWASFSTR